MNLNIPSYIITMQGNQTSELLSQQCFDSAKKFSIEPKIFPAIHGKQIDIEWKKHNLKDFKFNQRIKKLSLGMKGCTLSHFLLWKKSIEINKPILILEHDALIIRPIPHSIVAKFDEVCNLDRLSRLTTDYDNKVQEHRGEGVTVFMKSRPMASGLELYNKTHIKGAHGYVVKPRGAQRLVDWVWASGALASDVSINSISCVLTYSDTSYCRINPQFWNSKRMKGTNSFTRPNKQDKKLMREANNGI
tara:strand:+ start:1214 stop:1954 length:741 start_codon:yes stop_codon:yes gene_type:complete